MRNGVTLVATPAPADAWASAALADPFSLGDHLPGWTLSSTATSGWSDASRLYELDDGSHVVLPLLRRRAGALVLAASMPTGHGFGGLVGERARDPDVVAAVLADLAELGWASVRIRPEPDVAHLWEAAAPAGARLVPRRAHLLDLDVGEDALLAAMRKSTRRAIRRCAERDDLVVEEDRSRAVVDEYIDLWSSSLARWAEQQHEPLVLARLRAKYRDPPERLHRLAGELGRSFSVWMARIDGTPVAANVAVTARSGHVIRAAIDRDLVRSSGVMQYVDWVTMGHAASLGATVLNLGESGTDPSLTSYKEGLGARPVDYVEIRLERFPVTPVDAAARNLVKKVIGFRG